MGKAKSAGMPPIYNDKGKLLCGAVRSNGERCRNRAAANGRCKFHGGRSLPPGPTNPAFKHGRYSRALPERMRARAEEALADENLLAMHDAIAALDARVIDLFERSDKWTGSEAWDAMLDLVKVMKEALRKTPIDAGGARQAADDLRAYLLDGMAESQLWRDVLDTLEQRRRIVDTEVKRRKDLENFITAEQALAFMHAVAEIVRNRVDDPKTLAQIGADFRQLAVRTGGVDPGNPPDPAGSVAAA